jgi:hypothetical protein
MIPTAIPIMTAKSETIMREDFLDFALEVAENQSFC